MLTKDDYEELAKTINAAEDFLFRLERRRGWFTRRAHSDDVLMAMRQIANAFSEKATRSHQSRREDDNAGE